MCVVQKALIKKQSNNNIIRIMSNNISLPSSPLIVLLCENKDAR